MFDTAERAATDVWSFIQVMPAIAHDQLSTDQAARNAIATMTVFDTCRGAKGMA